MLQPLEEVEKDYSYSIGFLETWLSQAPDQVKENLKVLVSGISSYREKYLTVQEQFSNLQTRYNELMAVSAQHLEFMRQQKQQLDEALIDTQREYHKDADTVG